MKSLILAAAITGMSLSSFGASFIDTSTGIVKVDKKKKKKGQKKAKHKKCEAYNG